MVIVLKNVKVKFNILIAIDVDHVGNFQLDVLNVVKKMHLSFCWIIELGVLNVLNVLLINFYTNLNVLTFVQKDTINNFL